MDLRVEMEKNVYVVSDIHNDADRFQRLLGEIHFSKEDMLIIDGDIFDRGDNPVDLYFEILKHDNILCIRGNHDEWVRAEINTRIYGEKGLEYISYGTFEQLSQRLTEVDMINLEEWIGEMPYYLNLDLGGRIFLISHAQTYPAPKRIWNPYKFMMGDMHYEKFLTGAYQRKGIISVVGHTPTDNGRIWKSPDGGLIRIDCGNGFQDLSWGRLGAIRLNDMKEYYVAEKCGMMRSGGSCCSDV